MQSKQLTRTDDYDQPRATGDPRTTILIVDDDTAARLTISAMISNDDYRVVLGTGAAEARDRLARIGARRHHLRLRDGRCERRRIFPLLKADRVWRYVPIIAVTRIDNPVVRADLLNAGADAIAAKPINAPELRAMVYAAVRMRRQYQSLMREAAAGS